jgi:hypothetical protein
MLTDHKINPTNDKLEITHDDRSATYGNASHAYEIAIPGMPSCLIGFQCGPIAEVGVNGVTDEALLAIVIDRMRGFQSGPFSCRENAVALTKMEEAMQWLHWRTRGRVERNVEGTNKV